MPTEGRTCGACGARGQHGAFCEECEAALPDEAPAPADASAPASADAPAPASADTPDSAPADTSDSASADTPASASADTPAPEPDSEAVPGPPSEAVPEPGPPDQEPSPAAGEPAASAGRAAPAAGQSASGAWQPLAGNGQSAPAAEKERARALIVPVGDPRAAATGPVLPGHPEVTLPYVVLMPETDDSGGRPCPWCTAANPVDRYFCRRCAMSLAEEPGSAHRWWRRLLGWWGRAIPFAGERPRLPRDPGQLFRWMAALIVVIAVLSAATLWGGDAVAAVENHFARSHLQPVATMTASSSDTTRPVWNLHDGYNNTWWGDGVTGRGTGVHLDATFAQPQDPLDIVITPGAGIAQDAFTAESSPQTIGLTMTSADGKTTSKTLSLVDSPGPQTFAVQGSDITRARLTIESSYLGSSPKSEVAITEIEFFTKS